MQPFSVDVKDLLEAGALWDSIYSVPVFGTDLFISHEPDEPDTCITIYDTQGLDPDQEINPDNNFTEHPACQIRVRSNSYEEAYQIMRICVKTLKIRPQAINNSCYGSITQSGTINSLGQDERDRTRLTTNFIAIREEL